MSPSAPPICRSDQEFHQFLAQYWAEQGFDIRRWVRASRTSSCSTPETATSWCAVTFDEDGVARFSGDSGRSGLDNHASGVSIVDLLDDILQAVDEDAAGGNGNGSGGGTPASSMAMVSLPEMTVGDEKGEQGECPVCLLGFEEGDKLRKMPCVDSHCFHEQCIFNWLLISRHCPLCRHALPAENDSEAEKE